MIEVLRTPEERFENLADYPWDPNYVFVENDQLRMHYLDVGNPSGELILLLHGEPSWSYLYRHMIPGLVAAGYRVIAPDLIGFGKSDKPKFAKDISYANMSDWFNQFVLKLDLNNITVFMQDWGGLLGLRTICDFGDRFSRIILSNTFLPTGQEAPNYTFESWKNYVSTANPFNVGGVIEIASSRHLKSEEISGYEAPFPSEDYKIAAKLLPSLIPTKADDPEGLKNIKYWEKLGEVTLPCITIFGQLDSICRGLEKPFQTSIPGAKDQEHLLIPNANHFIQEDAAEELVLAIIAFCEANPI